MLIITTAKEFKRFIVHFYKILCFSRKHTVFHMIFLVLFYVNTPIICYGKLLFIILFKHFGTLESCHFNTLFFSPFFNVCVVSAHKHFGNFFASPD